MASTTRIARSRSSRSVNEATRKLVSCLESLFQRLLLQRTHRLQGELSAKEWEALAVLGLRGSLIMGDLAEALGVPLSSMTRTANRLVKRGLVERTRSEADRRVVRVQLSKAGKTHQRKFLQARLAMGRDMLAPLSPGEREIFLELITKIARLAKPQSSSRA